MKFFTNSRKLIFWILSCIVFWASVVSVPVTQAWVFQWTENPYVLPTDNWSVTDLKVIGDGQSTQDWLVAVIKWVVNRALGILAFIALIVLLYGWFLMVTAAWDDGRYDKWFTILKQAAVWLVIIGIARFIVSIVFRLINLTAEPAASWGAGTQS